MHCLTKDACLGTSLVPYLTILATDVGTQRQQYFPPASTLPLRPLEDFNLPVVLSPAEPTVRRTTMRFRLTKVEETALRTPMVIQMKGNTFGGGIQSGRRRSLLASFSTDTFGRRAFNTPNVLHHPRGVHEQGSG